MRPARTQNVRRSQRSGLASVASPASVAHGGPHCQDTILIKLKLHRVLLLVALVFGFVAGCPTSISIPDGLVGDYEMVTTNRKRHSGTHT
jgi:hypothetical protein